MKIRVSQGAMNTTGRDWFVVHPLDGQTRVSVAGTLITHDMEVMSLLSAGRAVYEMELPDDPDDDPRMGMSSGIWTRITLTP